MTWSTRAWCASATDEKSASPEGLKKQSTTFVPPAAGRLIGRHSLPNVCWIWSRILLRVGVVGVDPVHDDEAAKLAPARPIHHARRDHLDAGLRVDDDRCGLDRIERADRLPDEIGEAWRVDQVDARIRRVEVQHRRSQRMLPALLESFEVAGRRAPFDAARGADRAAPGEQRLGKRRLAGRPVAHQRYSTKLFRRVLGHAFPPLECNSRSSYALIEPAGIAWGWQRGADRWLRI